MTVVISDGNIVFEEYNAEMQLIFVTGGARSGKSRFACELGEKCAGVVTYIATGEAKDEEMKRRIEEHQRKRPADWKLIEEPCDMLEAIGKARGSDCVIIDCLTLLITNWLLDCAVSAGKHRTPDKILEKLSPFLDGLEKLSATVVVVSNEVGMGIVPETELGRDFRDICGYANQLVAAKADEVYFLVSGIPQKLK